MSIQPGAIAKLVGGVLILLSTFIDWYGFGPVGWNAYDGDLMGFAGILLLLLSLDIVAVTAIETFAPQVNLPDNVLGFSMNELTLMAGFASFILGFSLAFQNGSKGGTLLCALGGAVVVVGAILEQQVGSDEPARPI